MNMYQEEKRTIQQHVLRERWEMCAVIHGMPVHDGGHTQCSGL